MESRHKLFSSTSLPALLIVAKAKGAAGGQGGTLFTCALADLFAMSDIRASLVQTDNQDKLAHSFGSDVLRVNTAKIGRAKRRVL